MGFSQLIHIFFNRFIRKNIHVVDGRPSKIYLAFAIALSDKTAISALGGQASNS